MAVETVVFYLERDMKNQKLKTEQLQRDVYTLNETVKVQAEQINILSRSIEEITGSLGSITTILERHLEAFSKHLAESE